MSISYYVDAVLDAPYNEQNAKKIFERGSKLGLIYYPKYGEPTDSDCLQSLTAEEAAIKIMLLTQDIEELWNAYFTIKFEESTLDLRLGPYKNGQLMSVSIDCGVSFRRYYNLDLPHPRPIIDFARGIRLVLALCKDFSIIELNTTAM